MSILKNVWCMIFHRKFITTRCEGENCWHHCPACKITWNSRR